MIADKKERKGQTHVPSESIAAFRLDRDHSGHLELHTALSGVLVGNATLSQNPRR